VASRDRLAAVTRGPCLVSGLAAAAAVVAVAAAAAATAETRSACGPPRNVGSAKRGGLTTADAARFRPAHPLRVYLYNIRLHDGCTSLQSMSAYMTPFTLVCALSLDGKLAMFCFSTRAV